MDHGKIWGLSRTYNTDYEYMLTPAGGKVVYGYPCPSNPHIIKAMQCHIRSFHLNLMMKTSKLLKRKKGFL